MIDTATLCRVCDEADVLGSSRNLNKNSREVKLQTLTNARQTPHCPLCAFAIRTIDATRGHSSLHGIDANIWLLQSFGLPNFNNAPSFQIAVLGFGKTPTYSYERQHYIFASVDLFEFAVPRSADNALPWKRRRVQPCFDCKTIKGWLASCKDNHHHRIASSTAEVVLQELKHAGGLWLVNVETLATHEVPPDDSPRYTALSYVWGARFDQLPVLKRHTGADFDQRNNLRGRLNGTYDLDALPRSFIDAIQIARDLGIPYIWIDQLCNDQEAHPLKSLILASMGAIYAKAELVVVAADGVNSEAGLPGSSAHPRPEDEPLAQFKTSSGHFFEIYSQLEDHRIHMGLGPWGMRGWTLQEYAYARQTLVVFRDEILFICSSHLKREGYDYEESTEKAEYERIPMHEIRQSLSNGSLFEWEDFRSVVGEYCHRNLSFERDRLAAISGVLWQASGHDDLALKCGLVLNCFGEGLTWEPSTDYLHIARQVPSDVAPSWSWAASGRPVHYRQQPLDLGSAKWPFFTYETLSVPNTVLGRPHSQILDTGDTDQHERPRIESQRRLFVGFESFTQWRSYVLSLVQSITPRPERIPVLHLVTLVFTARIEPVRRIIGSMQYFRFAALGNDYYHEPDNGSKWFDVKAEPLRTNELDNIPHIYLIQVDERKHPDLEVNQLQTFSLVWTLDAFGWFCDYVLLLRRVEVEHGYECYVRTGIVVLTYLGLQQVLKHEETHAAWKYIVLK
ncbi:heterokaryon incompatibility protein-domain-containing protein [Xylariaceae sp. FL1272]|nr:heterokaryon incompatibility protein-domain-containing protein [Xylariaceae sp. FL1272]